MSQYIIHSDDNHLEHAKRYPVPQHQHEGYYTPNLSYKPIVKFDGVSNTHPSEDAKNDTKHPVVHYKWNTYDKSSGRLKESYHTLMDCDWRMLSDKVFIEKQLKGKDFSPGRFHYVDGEVSNVELAKAANAIQLALKEYAKSHPEFVAAPHPQHSGYYSPNLRHSDEDVIDCTSDHIEHAMNNVSYTRHYGFGGTPNYGTLTVKRTTGEADDYAVTLERKGSRYQFFAKSSDSVDSIKQRLRSASDKILTSDEVNNTANLIKAVLREAVSKYSSQHQGYYSPNLQHSEPDYLSVKMSDIDDNHLEHAANPYPYRPDVTLNGNQLIITFTDVANNRTATLSVNLVGAKNYKDVEDRLDNLLQAAYTDGKDWGNISKNAFDSIMRQARSLNIYKTIAIDRYHRGKSKSS